MMSLEIPIEVKIAKEFLAAQDFFNKIGYELIGTKDINEETIFLVKEKIAREFLAAQDFFNKIGFELIGTKDINEETIFLVKEKKS